MNEDICDFGDGFLSENSTFTPVDNVWTSFKQTCLQVINKHVPSKMTSTKFSQPWSDRVIRRIARRKKNAYMKARRTGKKKMGWSGGAKVRARAYCACSRCGWGCLDIFLSSVISLFFLPLSGRRPDID